MSERLLRNLEELANSISNNMAQDQGQNSDPAIALVAAKYHEALKKLAQE